MKYLYKIFFIILVNVIVVTCVNAYQLTCGSGPYKFGDTFQCDISVDEAASYEYIYGIAESNDYISCEILSSSLDSLDSAVGYSFYLSGDVQSYGKLLYFECSVVKNLKEDATTSLKFKNINYKTNDGDMDSVSLESDTIFLSKTEESKHLTKSRNTNHSESLIKSLSIDDVTGLNFYPQITQYVLQVPYDTKKLNFNFELYDSTSVVDIEGDYESLDVGENIIDIYITSKNDYETCYTFKITRLEEGENPYEESKDATLKSLKITGYDIDFKPEVFNYEIEIKSGIASVDLTAVPNVDGAKKTITYPNAYADGKNISIRVVSADGSVENTYVINLKEANKKGTGSSSSLIIVIIGVVVVVLILLVVIVILMKKKKNKKNNFSINNNISNNNTSNNNIPNNNISNNYGSVNNVNNIPNVQNTKPKTDYSKYFDDTNL